MYNYYMMNKFKQNKGNKFGLINPNYNNILIESIKEEKTKEFKKNEKHKLDIEKYKERFKNILEDIKKEDINNENNDVELKIDEIYIDNVEKVIDKEYIEPKMKNVVYLAIDKFIKKKDW